MENTTQQHTPQRRRRRRPAVSCVLCRRRKIRCNREAPCSNCVKSKSACAYDSLPTSLSPLTNTSEADLVGRIRELEQQVQRVTAQPRLSQSGSPQSGQSQSEQSPSRLGGQTRLPPTPVSGGTIGGQNLTLLFQQNAPSVARDLHVKESSQIGGTFYIHHGDPSLGQRADINRSVSHKKRMFGQSHWINSCVILCLEVIKLVEEYARDDSASVVTGLQRCKHFARQIKTQRTPQWPCTPTPELPPKAIADELLECYLRTSESLYRVLHVPSFLSQYETVWIDNAASDPTFLVLLKLVLAIGAASYNDTFTLRPSAIRWVYEAEAWLANPTLKHRLGLQYFQIYCLLVLARESTAVGEDLVWISTGGLFRAAVHMGLHRDPAHFPPRSHFANEMHRRIWNTIIELCLQASLNHGGPPLMSLADFDTNPPSNFNDDQLTEKHALPRPESQHTQASIAIALRKTYPIRLAITKFLNCIGTASSYDETLRLDAEFRQSYKGLRSAFQGFNCTSDRTASQVALRLADVILQRYLTALHMPFYGSALNDSAHAYSRKVALDASLKVWYAMNPLSDAMHSEGPLEEGILGRLCICASGFLRISVLQALLLASVELRQQVKDDDGFGPVPLRRDLLAIVQDGKTWHLKCVEAGETNIKGYIFAVLLCANIEGLMKGLERPELAAFLISHAHEAELQCFEILKNMLDQSQPEQNIESLGQMSLETTPGSLEGWDFMLPGMGLGDGNVDPLAWMFDQASTQASYLW